MVWPPIWRQYLTVGLWTIYCTSLLFDCDIPSTSDLTAFAASSWARSIVPEPAPEPGGCGELCKRRQLTGQRHWSPFSFQPVTLGLLRVDYFACDLYDTIYQVEANVIASGWSGMSVVSTDMHRYAAGLLVGWARSRGTWRVRGSQDCGLINMLLIPAPAHPGQSSAGRRLGMCWWSWSWSNMIFFRYSSFFTISLLVWRPTNKYLLCPYPFMSEEHH